MWKFAANKAWYRKGIPQNKDNKDWYIYPKDKNRYDFKMFFGMNDPHSNLLLTSVMPKALANIVSYLFLGRPYVNWIYSKKELENILIKLGYKNIEFYFAFPDYRFPEKIIHSEKSLNNFYPTINFRDKNRNIKIKRFFGFIIEYIVFRILKFKQIVPSFIVVAQV